MTKQHISNPSFHFPPTFHSRRPRILRFTCTALPDSPTPPKASTTVSVRCNAQSQTNPLVTSRGKRCHTLSIPRHASFARRHNRFGKSEPFLRIPFYTQCKSGVSPVEFVNKKKRPEQKRNLSRQKRVRNKGTNGAHLLGSRAILPRL